MRSLLLLKVPSVCADVSAAAVWCGLVYLCLAGFINSTVGMSSGSSVPTHRKTVVVAETGIVDG